MPAIPTAQPVTIANGASLSDAIRPNGAAMVGIEMPATWTTANLTFQVSVDGTTYNNLYDSTGTEVTVTAAASRYIQLNPASFEGFLYVKVRSGTSGTPVNQGGARTIKVVVEDL